LFGRDGPVSRKNNTEQADPQAGWRGENQEGNKTVSRKEEREKVRRAGTENGANGFA